jgi:hypothetical protein
MIKTPNLKRPEKIEDLLTPELVARLGTLDVSSRKIMTGKLKGERRSKRRGESVEFADHRPYVYGDDLRHIDWNIFGRLDKMFLKLFLEEEDLSLTIVIDCSASSDAGDPNKFVFMQRLAAALAYVGLVNLNRVGVHAVGDKGVREGEAPELGPDGQALPPQGLVSSVRDLRGKRRLQDLIAYILSIEPSGQTRFTDACKRIAITRRGGKGVMVVLSDFLIKEGYEAGLRLLKGQGYDVYAIQVLSPQEMEPTIGGDLRLKDMEDGDTAEVTITAPLIRKYKQILNAYCNRLHAFCTQRDIIHMTVKTDMAVDALVLDYLRRRGLLR